MGTPEPVPRERTGRLPNSVTIPVALLVTLLTAAAGGSGASLITTRADGAAREQRVEAVEKRVTMVEERQRQAELLGVRLEGRLDSIRDQIGEIGRQLDRITAQLTVAPGRRR